MKRKISEFKDFSNKTNISKISSFQYSTILKGTKKINRSQGKLKDKKDLYMYFSDILHLFQLYFTSIPAMSNTLFQWQISHISETF
jgi:hypothetical protein